MKTLTLVLAFAAVAAAQKPLKAKHKPAYIATSPGAGHYGGDIRGSHAAPQAYQAASPQSHHGGGGGFGGGSHHGSPSYASGIGKGASKPSYPLLLSDTRTLNSDGTINFNYQADNGLHQGETVDKDGTRRGFYSYPGADGKLITVKYSAGKNGFVAEGDHLPTQPQSAPYNPKQESADIYSSKQGSQQSFGGHGGSGHYSGGGHGGGSGHYSGSPIGGGHSSGAYRPSHDSGANHYSHSSIGAGGSGAGAFANFPDFSSQLGSSGHGGQRGHGGGASRYPSASSGHQGGHPGGSSSFSSLQGLGSSGHGGANFADVGSLGSSYSGPMFTAANPYQPQHTGPVNAGFDLGNGGHFAINFSPGVGQEYNPASHSGDFSSGQGSSGQGGQGRY